MAITGKLAYLKQLMAGLLALLMAPSAALAESKFLSLELKSRAFSDGMDEIVALENPEDVKTDYNLLLKGGFVREPGTL